MKTLFRRRSKVGVVLLISLQLILFSAVASAQSESFLALEDISKGMEGTGRTVVKGNQISTFSVKGVDVIDEPGELEDFIIVRASGEPIERSGEVAQGMSGSPIYLNGKLAGALSRAAQWSKDTDNPIELVTPIETMVQLLESNQPSMETRAKTDQREGSAKNSLEEAFPEKDIKFEGEAEGSSQVTLVFKRSTSPVMVSGFSKASFTVLKEGIGSTKVDKVYDPLRPIGESSIENLKNGISEYDLSFHNLGGGASGSGQAMELKPGGPFGAALTQGDFTIGALGTVTYKEGDSVLGFGHRFFYSEEVLSSF